MERIIHFCRLGDLLRVMCDEGGWARSRATLSYLVRAVPGSEKMYSPLTYTYTVHTAYTYTYACTYPLISKRKVILILKNVFVIYNIYLPHKQAETEKERRRAPACAPARSTTAGRSCCGRAGVRSRVRSYAVR